VAVVLAVAEGTAAARESIVLPAVGATFGAPYGTVWEAARGSLGAVGLPVADKAQGRIESEPYSFAFPAAGDATQVIWVSLAITVGRGDDQHTNVLVQPRVHDALLNGFTPGPTNNPWQDFFARVKDSLGRSSNRQGAKSAKRDPDETVVPLTSPASLPSGTIWPGAA
jgi:hypothetical protein